MPVGRRLPPEFGSYLLRGAGREGAISLIVCISKSSFPGGSDGKASAYNMGDLGWKDLLEKEMANHSSALAWKIPWIEEPGRLQFLGSQRVGHN